MIIIQHPDRSVSRLLARNPGVVHLIERVDKFEVAPERGPLPAQKTWT